MRRWKPAEEEHVAIKTHFAVYTVYCRAEATCPEIHPRDGWYYCETGEPPVACAYSPSFESRDEALATAQRCELENVDFYRYAEDLGERLSAGKDAVGAMRDFKTLAGDLESLGARVDHIRLRGAFQRGRGRSIR